MNYGKEFTKGLIRENPTLVSLLGMCPTLAVTTGAFNGIGMGLSTAFVLIFSNLVISLLRKVISEQVKLPCYIVIIATFVTLIQFLLHGFVPALYTNLGAFLELITVNCIILGRAEMFASKNTPLPSILDGAGMGLGFTLALFLMGSIREIFGSGSWFGLSIPFMQGHTMSLFVMPAGGFFVLGIIIAVVCRLSKKKPPKKSDAVPARMRLPAGLQIVRRLKHEHGYYHHHCCRFNEQLCSFQVLRLLSVSGRF